MRYLIATALTTALLAQTPPAEVPTKQEIADAYQSRNSSGSVLGGLRWERWSGEIRGWAIRSKKTSEQMVPGKMTPGLVTRQHRVQAKKSDWCSEYRLTERIPMPPFDQKARPSVEVEPTASKPCK